MQHGHTGESKSDTISYELRRGHQTCTFAISSPILTMGPSTEIMSQSADPKSPWAATMSSPVSTASIARELVGLGVKFSRSLPIPSIILRSSFVSLNTFGGTVSDVTG